MRNAKKLLIAISIIGAIVACALYTDLFHVYTVRDDSGGQMLWDANEGYLFLSVVRRGYQLSWPKYAWSALGQWFNVIPSPTDQRIFFIVIHVTPSAVERKVAKVTDDTAAVPHFFTPIGQTIYAYSEGTLYKWAGDHFDTASQEELMKMGGTEHLASDIDASVNGWTERGIGQVAGDASFSAAIGKETILTIRQGNVYKSPTDSATVELHRVGQPVQELWRIDGRPRRVSKTEYVRALSTFTDNRFTP